MTKSKRRTFEIQHVTVFEYENPVQRAVMLLRLQPRSDHDQKLLSFHYKLKPDGEPIALSDSFGNLCHLLDFQSKESAVVIESNSEVETKEPTKALPDADSISWRDLKNSIELVDFWEFLSPSARVYDCAELQTFLSNNDIKRGDTPLSSLLEAAGTLNRKIRYEPGTTKVDTKLENCLNLGSGVCQDFSHILLAIGRIWGIPCRYVSGYLHLFPEENHVITENASHAWGEFYFPNIGWVGIDSTNDTITDERYIRVSVGRDYNDAAPTKGVVFGGGTSTLHVNVSLTQRKSDLSDRQLPESDQ